MDTFPQLSPDETRILEGILKGKRNKEIAQELNLSLVAINRRVARLLKKLDASNRGVLIARYLPRESETVSINFSSLHEEALKVAHLVAAGFTNRKIAEVLQLSLCAVEARVYLWLLKPFGFSSRRVFTVAFLAWKPPINPPLPEKYQEIYEYVLRGMTNAEIASATGLSHQLIVKRVLRLLKRLRVASREEAIATYFDAEGMQPTVDFSGLAPKAMEVARLVAAGESTKEIAKRLKITPSHVNDRISTWLLKPFNLKNRYQLARAFIIWRDAQSQ